MEAKTTNLTCGVARAAQRLGVVTAVVIGAATSTALSRPETVVVRPGAVVRWSELVELDRALADMPKPRSVVKLYVPEPPPRYVGSSLRKPPIAESDTPRVDDPESKAATSLKARASIIASFAALPDDGILIPPDTNGAVGLDHVMTMLNTAVRIQDKSGSAVVPDVSLAGFWAMLAPASLADPRLVYDATVSRWYATVIANFRLPTSAVLLAVSASSDPTGVWSFYSIEADPAGLLWADFPDVGYSSKWLALTANMETIAGDNFSGVGMWVIEKADVLAGGPLEVTRFAPGFDDVGGGGAFALRPCRTFDPESTLYLTDNSGLRDPVDDRQMIRLSRITEGVGGGPIWSVVPGSLFSGSGLFRVPTNFRYGQIPASQRGSRKLIQVTARGHTHRVREIVRLSELAADLAGTGIIWLRSVRAS
ncbi:MAG: hypothetical protein IH989_07930, partial [Planctomycetes bacterium]|nr:hypothetical protein [Planctomycetota bacterium]